VVKCSDVLEQRESKQWSPIPGLSSSYRGVDKSLARPGRKQATATKLLLLQAMQKNILTVVHPTRSLRQHWLPRRTKNGDFSIYFFSRVGLRTYQHPCIMKTLVNETGWGNHEDTRSWQSWSSWVLYRYSAEGQWLILDIPIVDLWSRQLIRRRSVAVGAPSVEGDGSGDPAPKCKDVGT
jgi:hypothetical protein